MYEVEVDEATSSKELRSISTVCKYSLARETYHHFPSSLLTVRHLRQQPEGLPHFFPYVSG
jgi:hypothetical protein